MQIEDPTEASLPNRTHSKTLRTAAFETTEVTKAISNSHLGSRVGMKVGHIPVNFQLQLRHSQEIHLHSSQDGAKGWKVG